MVNRTSNIDSRLSKLFTYPNASIFELTKGVRIIEVGLYLTSDKFIITSYYSHIWPYLQYEALENSNGLSNGSIDTEDYIIQQYGIDSSRMAVKIFKLNTQHYDLVTTNDISN